ncbi:MAG: inosine/xanthosine triphosphatase [Planctomycetes bacterium]|jgi:inosine/xanthosine triphosphatase|nr:inosine/xanthosine triphosphatase [Planctomycetota bacterium]
MKKIIVASKNPIKIEATLLGFQKMFSEESFVVEGVSVSSGVSDQPKSNKEALLGARNRIINAQQEFPGADFYVGLEGGIESNEEDDEVEAFAWAAILSSDNKFGKGKTGTFFLPAKVVELLKQGKELGEADDIVFGTSNSKQVSGACGLLTNNILNRKMLYADAVILALIPFKNPDLY